MVKDTGKPRQPGLMAKLTGKSALIGEKARLESFLAAVPGEYCGWGDDGSLAWSAGFCALLGLKTIGTLSDIQNALTPSDAAVLEGRFHELQENGQSFTVTVRSADKRRTLRLSGRRGQAESSRFDVLWLDDITKEQIGQREMRTALEQAEEERDRLQNAFDRFPQPLWLRNARTEIIWCNRAYAEAVKISPATVIAEQRELSLKPLRRSAGKMPGKTMAQAALDAGAAEMIAAHMIVGGSRRLVNVFEIPLPAAGMVLGFTQDITREEELETEQKRYASANKELLEQLGTAIGIYNGEQKLEFYNSAYSQLWGLDDNYLNTRPRLGDLMEKLRGQRLLPEQADFRKFKQGWLNMFTSLLGPHEDMLYLPNGRALRMLVVPHPMGGLMMTFEDVTSRLELESSYNTLIAVQRETLDNLAEGVAVFGGDGRIKLWNPAFARLWRLNPEDLEGQPHVTRLSEKMKTRFDPAQWPKWQKILVAHSIDRSAQTGRLECADGALINFSTVPLPDGGVLVTHVDVTDTTRVENALRDKNAALEAAERLKLDFLANVSYQLRTPLNAIMGFSEILRNEYFGPLNERQKEYTAAISDSGDRLISLVNDILDLSTIEAGYMALAKEKVPVDAVLDAIRDLTTEWARKEKIEIRLDCPKSTGAMFVDERRLKQVLLNLVRNAIAFTPAGGTITLSARRTDTGDMALSVTDTGPGVPPEDRERIFMPFERAAQTEKSARNLRGAGLGLALVKNIVELHGGSVSLESEKGRGSVFTIILPTGEAVKKIKSKVKSAGQA